jgi:hypothetical protein
LTNELEIVPAERFSGEGAGASGKQYSLCLRGAGVTLIIKNTGGRKPPTRNQANGPVCVARDAKSGQYVLVGPRGKTTSETIVVGRGTQNTKHPGEFIKEFTKSPVVDNVMKRLSR